MKGYKAFESDLTCRGFQYKIGETYTMVGQISLCERGFHFCKSPSDCFSYYPKEARLCEIEADGAIIEGQNKSVCSKITIVREITGVGRNRIVYGNGDGDGNGYGDGNGDGDGNGYGNGDGNGYGYGDGYGYDNRISKVLTFKEV